LDKIINGLKISGNYPLLTSVKGMHGKENVWKWIQQRIEEMWMNATESVGKLDLQYAIENFNEIWWIQLFLKGHWHEKVCQVQ
jgi:hypothetical protein